MHPRRGFLAAAAFVAALGVAAAACGGSSGSSGSTTPTSTDVSPAGDIPDSQAFVAFASASGGYTVQVPEGWARTDLPTGATFTDKLNSIRVESAPVAAPPTETTARTDEVPALQSLVADFKLVKITTAPRTAGDAVLILYRGSSQPDPVTGKRVTQDIDRYEFWSNGTQVTITLTSPKGADNVDSWKTVTNSFAWQS